MTTTTTDLLNTPIEFLKGVGEKRGAVLRKEFNIQTFNDLLYYFPYRHIDKSHVYHVSDIVNDGGRYRLSITEQKAGKQRVFTVPLVIQQYMENYCLRNRISRTALMFPITTREVQKVLARVCDYLGYEGISTYSFRKWYATEIYKANGYDIALVQRLLQHSSAAVTQRYIGIEPQRIEQAIEGHAELL